MNAKRVGAMEGRSMRFHSIPTCILSSLAALLTCLVVALPTYARDAQRFLFIGDLPYTKDQSVRLKGSITKAIKKGNFPFLVHYGDLQSGGVSCIDEDGNTKFGDYFKQITGLMADENDTSPPRPVFYTPGDNDWTDCDRRFKKGKSKSELNQLDLLRRIFFLDTPLKLSDKWKYERQPLYPENALWRFGKVQFATLHLVGTNNGRVDILMDDVGLALARVRARDQANRVWLNIIFEKAKKRKDPAAALIIATQADVTDPNENAPCTPANPMYCDAFAGFRAQLIKHAAAFKKPVLLVHGDTSPYCLDKGFGGAPAPNLWRLNAAGDYKLVDATVVTFHPGKRDTPFSAKGLVSGEKPEAGC